MESFYRTLKRELVQDAHVETPEQAQKEIFKYIELYYNTKRMHSSLGYIQHIYKYQYCYEKCCHLHIQYSFHHSFFPVKFEKHFNQFT